MLAVADVVVGAAIGLGLVISTGSDVAYALVTIAGAPVAAKLLGLYDFDHRAIRHLTLDELPLVAGWSLLLTVAASRVIPEAVEPLVAIAIGAGAVVAGLAARGLARLLWRRWTPVERTLILGEGEPARAVARKIELFPDMHLELDRIEPPAPLRAAPREKNIEAIRRAVVGIDRIILAWSDASADLIEQLTEVCRERQVKFSVVSPFRGKARPALVLSQVAELPLLEYNTWDAPRSTMAIKRAADLAIAGAGLVLTAPLFVAIAIAIKLADRGPVFFRQERAGRGGKPFRMLKFRSMVVGAADRLRDLVDLDELVDPMFKFRDDPRVTRVGRFLRRYSLDELPQLLNVLRGHMSIVGPRPEELAVVARYRPEHMFRLSLKPGLTGPMQVFGRGHLTFQERLAVELDYVENLSFQRDLKILLLTLPAVLSGRGAL